MWDVFYEDDTEKQGQLLIRFLGLETGTGLSFLLVLLSLKKIDMDTRLSHF